MVHGQIFSWCGGGGGGGETPEGFIQAVLLVFMFRSKIDFLNVVKCR